MSSKLEVAGFFKYVWPYTSHQALKDWEFFSDESKENENKNKITASTITQSWHLTKKVCYI